MFSCIRADRDKKVKFDFEKKLLIFFFFIVIFFCVYFCINSTMPKKIYDISLVNKISNSSAGDIVLENYIDKQGKTRFSFYLEGWAFITSINNDVLNGPKKIALYSEADRIMYSFKCVNYERKDVSIRKKNSNVSKSGFKLVIPQMIINKGKYTIWYCFEKDGQEYYIASKNICRID